MQKFLYVLLVSLIGLPAFAHLGLISGKVFDQTTNLPLRGVTVQLTGLGKSTITNELGQYRFEALVAAPYKIELSHVGFKTQVILVNVQDDQTTSVETVLSSSSIDLSEVVVSSGRAHDQQLISSLDIGLSYKSFFALAHSISV